MVETSEGLEWAYIAFLLCSAGRGSEREREPLWAGCWDSLGERVYGGGGGVRVVVKASAPGAANEDVVDIAGEARLGAKLEAGDLRGDRPPDVTDKLGEVSAELEKLGLSAPLFGLGELGRPITVLDEFPDSGPLLIPLLLLRIDVAEGEGRGMAMPGAGLGKPPLMFGT